MKKSSFKYWFLHWCAFNVIAYQLGCWKPRCLFHDWEKPWLNLFLPYEKVRKFHRKWSKHHWESQFRIDYEMLIVDWECGRLTKPNETLNARGYFELRQSNLSAYDCLMIETHLLKLGL